MFGHPGMYAMEYAGVLEESRVMKVASSKAKSIFSKKDKKRSLSVDAGSNNTESSQNVEELSTQQKRRGDFINHTPRDYEVNSPVTSEYQRDSRDAHICQQSFRHANSYGLTATTSEHDQKPLSDYGNPDYNNMPAELDSTGIGQRLSDRIAPLSLTSSRCSKTNSLASNLNNQHQRRVSGGTDGRDIPTTLINKGVYENKTHHRRQVPLNVAGPDRPNTTRHSPLEPWVEQYRRETIENNVDDLPPQLEMDDISGISTFRAIQEYFERQMGSRSRLSGAGASTFDLTSAPADGHLSDPSYPRTHNALEEPAVNFSAEAQDIFSESTPHIPERNPRRLNTPSKLLERNTSRLSLSSDFMSAAQGQYSPYEDKSGTLQTPKKLPGPVQVAEASPSRSGKMAPPIMEQTAVSASTELNDLIFYLRNTGPSPPEPTSKPREKSGLKMFKSNNKKSLAARVGSVEGSPQTSKPKPPTPACAREMTTSSGARHLHIVLPTDTLSSDQTVSLPISGHASDGHSKRVSITWTDEMLNPLASPELEHVISDLNTPEPFEAATRTTPIRPPKKSPASPKRVPVESHPLVTREEQTRARKLKDLKQIKKKDDMGRNENALPGRLPPTPVQSPEPVQGSSTESITPHEDEDVVDETAGLRQQITALQGQNAGLTKALGSILGMQSGDRDLDTEEVLKAFGQIRGQVRYCETPSSDGHC